MTAETAPETRDGYRKIQQGLYAGSGFLTLEGIALVTDLKIGILGHAFLIIGGVGLTGSSALYIRDLNNNQTTNQPEQDQQL